MLYSFTYRCFACLFLVCNVKSSTLLKRVLDFLINFEKHGLHSRLTK